MAPFIKSSKKPRKKIYRNVLPVTRTSKCFQAYCPELSMRLIQQLQEAVRAAIESLVMQEDLQMAETDQEMVWSDEYEPMEL